MRYFMFASLVLRLAEHSSLSSVENFRCTDLNTLSKQAPLMSHSNSWKQCYWDEYQTFLAKNHIDEICRTKEATYIFELLDANGFVARTYDNKGDLKSLQINFPSVLPQNIHPSFFQKVYNAITRKISFNTQTFNSNDLQKDALNAIDEIYTEYRLKEIFLENLHINNNSPPILTNNQLNITRDGIVILTDNNLNATDPDDPTGTGLMRTMLGHGDMVASVIYNPQENLLASGSWDGSIKLWNGTTGLILHSLVEGEKVYSVAFHPTMPRLVSGGESKVVKVWDTDNESLIYNLIGHNNFITSVAYNSKGSKILSASYDQTIRIWNADASLLHILTGHTNYITVAIFNPVTDEVISGSADDTIKIWKEDGSLSRNITSHTNGVLSLSIHPTGHKLACLGNDNSISILSLPDGYLLQKLIGQEGDITSIAFNLQGDRLVSGSTDGNICIWNEKDGSLLRSIAGDIDGINSVAFNSIGEEIASGSFYGYAVKIWTAHVLPSFIFTASNIQNGHFANVYEPKNPITTFHLHEIQSKQVCFIQEHCNLPPNYLISVSNGFTSTEPTAPNINYKGTLPILTRNRVTLKQGQIITLTTDNFNVSDSCTDPLLVKFSISNLQHGQLSSFDLQGILNQQVNVTHDGSCGALSYEVAVANNYGSTIPVAGNVVYTNLPPALTTNQIVFYDQEKLTITIQNLNATSLCAKPSEIIFTINGLDPQIGSFVEVSKPTVPTTTFTLKDVFSEQIQFIHSGGCHIPSYSVYASDLTSHSNPQPANVTLKKIPHIINNALEVYQGQTTPVTAINLSSTECGQAKEDLMILITDLAFGYFNNIQLKKNVTFFTQGMVNNGTISFTHDGSNQAPHYNITVCNGSTCTASIASRITYHSNRYDFLYWLTPLVTGVPLLGAIITSLICYTKYKKSHPTILEKTPLLKGHGIFSSSITNSKVTTNTPYPTKTFSINW